MGISAICPYLGHALVLLPRLARKVLTRQDRGVKNRMPASSLVGLGIFSRPFAKRMPVPICILGLSKSCKLTCIVPDAAPCGLTFG